MPVPLIIGIAIILACLPVVLSRVPPLLDYPNHLARIWLLSGGTKLDSMAHFYHGDWHNALTNIGMDAIAVSMAPHVSGAESAMRIMIVASLIMPPMGAIILNRMIYKDWSVWQIGFVVFAFNGIFLAGFLSFMIGIGSALLAAAADLALAKRSPPVRLIARATLGILLLWFHALALAFYLALLAGLAVGPSLREALASSRTLGATSMRVAGSILPAALPATLLLLLSGAPGPWNAPDQHDALLPSWGGYDFIEKVRALTTAFGTYEVPLDLAMALCVFAVARWALAREHVGVHGGLVFSSAGLLTLAILLPNTLGGTGWMDRRFPIMALLCFLAALSPAIPSRNRSAVALLLLGLVAVRTTWIGWIWSARQSDVTAVERATAAMPLGSALLVAFEYPSHRFSAPAGRYIPRGQMPTYEHLGALAVVRREAFVPTLFTLRGRHALRVLPPWDEVTLANGLGVSVTQLDDPEARASRPYLRDWRRRFEYLLVLDGDHPVGGSRAPPTSGISLIADEGFARLYRIERP